MNDAANRALLSIDASRELFDTSNMNDTISPNAIGDRTPRLPRRAWPWALLGLALTIAAPFAWFATLENPFLRSSGLPMFALLGISVVASLIAVARGRWGVRTVSGISLFLAGFLTFGFFVLSKLPAHQITPDVGDLAPDFRLTDSAGNNVSLRETLAAGPVWLVFYRGHW